MPDPIPTDDLYARLGVPVDADRASIDRAWRALLKQHHPDIAGSVSLELAKLINVAHDWPLALSFAWLAVEAVAVIV